MKKIFIYKTFSILLSVLIFTSVIVSAPIKSSAAIRSNITDSDPVPVNPNANQTCKNFYQYLVNVGRSDQIISGAFSLTPNSVDNENDYHRYITEYFGVTPVVFGGGWRMFDKMIERYSEGCVPLIQDMIGCADDMTSRNLSPADGVVNYDSTNPDRNEEIYQAYRERLKSAADKMQTLEENGVMVYMYRPFIEMNNSSNQGFFDETIEGCESFKRVWQQMVDYFVNERHLTGILMVYAPMGFGDSLSLYPGEEYVDVNAPTVYSLDYGAVFEKTNNDYWWMKEINRPFGFSEGAPREGNNCPTGDWKKYLESVLYRFPECAFINCWFDNLHTLMPTKGSSTYGNYNGEYFIKNPAVITTDEAIDWKSSTKVESNGVATFYKDKNCSGKIGSLLLGEYTSSSLKKAGIDLSGIKSVNSVFGYGILAFEKDNFEGETYLLSGKQADVSSVLKKAQSLKIIKLENLSYYKDVWASNNDTYVIKVNDGYTYRYETNTDSADNSLDITIDLGESVAISQVSVDLAGFYESYEYNIPDFSIAVSDDDINYAAVYNVLGNLLPAVNVNINPVNARYVKLHIITPNSSKAEVDKQRVSLAEISVLGLNVSNIANAISLKDVVMPETDSGDSSSVGDDEPNNQIEDITDITDPEANNSYADDLNLKEKPTTTSKIPEFYNYVWLIICGFFVVLFGGACLIIFIKLRKLKA